mgnify:CR=1 FL=1
MDLKIHVDFDKKVIYEYNIFNLQDFFNRKYFLDKGGIGNLKKFLGVKTKREAYDYIEQLVDDYFEELFDHLLTSGKSHIGKFTAIYIVESHPELRHMRGLGNVNVAVIPHKRMKSKKRYLFHPEGKIKNMISDCFNSITGLKWKSPQAP